MGACGEAAVAKLFGAQYEARVDTFKQVADVGKRVEVKWSRGKYLILDDEDRCIKDRYWFLVRGYLPVLEVVGFIQGKDVFEMDRDKFFRTSTRHPERPKAWFIPQEILLPFEDYPFGSILE